MQIYPDKKLLTIYGGNFPVIMAVARQKNAIRNLPVSKKRQLLQLRNLHVFTRLQ